MDRAFKYVQLHGLCAESDYPYTGKKGPCQKCTPQPYTNLSGYQDVEPNEKALGVALEMGPVSVAIEADQSGFQLYKEGVYSGPCGTTLDHGVLLVGYGTDADGQDYWKIKNSWGSSWGEEGYIRIIRHQDQCGVADQPSYPIC